MAVTAPAADATAAPGTIQVAVEPGVANLAAGQEQQLWGFFGGFSAAIEVHELISVAFHFDRKVLLDTEPEIAVLVWGPSVIYQFDLDAVVPFVGLGLAGMALSVVDGPQAYAEIVPVLSAGLNARIAGGLLLGAVFRYYPYQLEAGDLLSPSYTSINLRLGFYLVP